MAGLQRCQPYGLSENREITTSQNDFGSGGFLRPVRDKLILIHAPPHPDPLPQLRWRRGRIVRRLLENSCDWIGRTVILKSGISQWWFPLLGERKKGEGERQNKFPSAARPLHMAVAGESDTLR